MDKKLSKAIYVLVLMGIVYMAFLLYPQVAGLFKGLIGVLTPFVVGFAGAFILHPIVDWLVDRKIKRIFAVLGVVVATLVVVVLFFGSFLPLVFAEFVEVIRIAPELLSNIITVLEDTIFGGVGIDTQYNFDTFDWQSIIISGFDTTGELVTFLISKAYTSVSFALITPILLIYFLFDYNNIREYVKNFVKKHEFNRLHKFLSDFEKLLSRYVGGLLIVMFVLTIISTIMFLISGLDNALLFGFIIGLTNMIPFIGNIIGGAIAVVFALSQSLTLAIIILIEVIVLVIIESNFVTPMIQSKSISINPLLIIFGITIFGYIFGFFGVLLAIPLIIFFKLIIKHYFEKL